MPRRPPQTHPLFASCAPGLEPILSGELAALGLAGSVVPGGVELEGTLETAARLNLWLRTATRVLVRLATFPATTFAELEKRAGAIAFDELVRPGAPVGWKVTCKKSRLYHSGAVAERLHGALEKKLGKPSPALKPSEDDAVAPAQQLFVRFAQDVCTVSADTSGALLHQRGIRTHVSEAPLRETLAAALLLHAGYRGGALLDPLCGAGTVPLEAALIARRRAPGLVRTFALLGWPAFVRATWEELIAAARAQEQRPSQQLEAVIEGSDADPKSVEAARKNARAAGLDELVFSVRELAALPKAASAGLVAANPPYGQRVEARGQGARALVHDLLRLVRERRPLNATALIAPLELLGSAHGKVRSLRTTNGGLSVRLDVHER